MPKVERPMVEIVQPGDIVTIDVGADVELYMASGRGPNLFDDWKEITVSKRSKQSAALLGRFVVASVDEENVERGPNFSEPVLSVYLIREEPPHLRVRTLTMYEYDSVGDGAGGYFRFSPPLTVVGSTTSVPVYEGYPRYLDAVVEE